MKPILILIFATILFVGCEEVPVYLPPPGVTTSGKVILVEDLTGVECSNCPAAAQRLEEIVAEAPESVIVVGIHGDQQTKPYTSSDGELRSKYDFRNEDASFLEEYLKPWLGKPAIAFDRRQFEGQQNLSISGVQNIRPRIEQQLAEPQVLNIESDYTYDTLTRVINIDIGVIPLVNLEGNFFTTVLVTESHIIDYQLSSLFPGWNPMYEHQHVLRDVITQQQGDPLEQTLNIGELYSKSISYEIPTDDQGLWIVENLEFVVFVTDHTDGNKDVLQAHAFKIK